MKEKKQYLSPIVHGHWRLADWNLSPQQLLSLTKSCLDMGITSFDHADIYGDYQCEALFGEALKAEPFLRSEIQIITKCGIKLLSDKFPQRRLKIYDYSYEHIVGSAEQSLKNLKTDYIDLLLLHRPSPFFEPEEVAKAFLTLKEKGKVLHFGVSNFLPMQFEMLQNYCDMPLVTNQVEVSPLCLEHFDNGNMDFFLKEKIQPMAWSPLAGGRIFNPKTEQEKRVHDALWEVAQELDHNAIDIVAYAWLLQHPAGIIPVVGSGNPDRIRAAVSAQDLQMSLEQWFMVYNAAKGEELP